MALCTMLVVIFFIAPATAVSNGTEKLGLDIAKVLYDNGMYNILSSLLAASGVGEELQNREAGAGITFLAPMDRCFGDIGVDKFQSLPAYQKSIILKYHVLPSYYRLDTLRSIIDPVHPTLATDDVGAGLFLLKIFPEYGSPAFDTGLVRAFVTRTIYDKSPIAIYAVSKFLLPKEYFG